MKMERYLTGRELIPDGWAAKLARRYSGELEAALAPVAQSELKR